MAGRALPSSISDIHLLNLVDSLRDIAVNLRSGKHISDTCSAAADMIEQTPFPRWSPMALPPVVDPGCEARVLVAYRSKSRDHSSSGEMYYLNRFELDWEDDGPCEKTGWFDRYEDVDGSATYRVMSEEFVEHLGWTHMPVMPEPRS